MTVVTQLDDAVQPREYKGIQFIQMSDLTVSQRQKVSNMPFELINIRVDGTVLNQCIQYDEYVRWYNQIYKVTPSLV